MEGSDVEENGGGGEIAGLEGVDAGRAGFISNGEVSGAGEGVVTAGLGEGSIAEVCDDFGGCGGESSGLEVIGAVGPSSIAEDEKGRGGEEGVGTAGLRQGAVAEYADVFAADGDGKGSVLEGVVAIDAGVVAYVEHAVKVQEIGSADLGECSVGAVANVLIAAVGGEVSGLEGIDGGDARDGADLERGTVERVGTAGLSECAISDGLHAAVGGEVSALEEIVTGSGEGKIGTKVKKGDGVVAVGLSHRAGAELAKSEGFDAFVGGGRQITAGEVVTGGTFRPNKKGAVGADGVVTAALIENGGGKAITVKVLIDGGKIAGAAEVVGAGAAGGLGYIQLVAKGCVTGGLIDGADAVVSEDYVSRVICAAGLSEYISAVEGGVRVADNFTSSVEDSCSTQLISALGVGIAVRGKVERGGGIRAGALVIKVAEDGIADGFGGGDHRGACGRLVEGEGGGDLSVNGEEGQSCAGVGLIEIDAGGGGAGYPQLRRVAVDGNYVSGPAGEGPVGGDAPVAGTSAGEIVGGGDGRGGGGAGCGNQYEDCIATLEWGVRSFHDEDS